MPSPPGSSPRQQKLLRVIADVFLINASALSALVLRFLYLIAFEPAPTDITYNALFWVVVSKYFHSAWLLTAVCLVVFALSGFYTRGRAYQGRYKALVVTQAVSLAYLLFGFIAYFLGGKLNVPRAALVLAWAVSVVVFVLSRVWAWLWSNLIRAEINQEKQVPQKVSRVLVIGGAGYIGSALLPKLLAKGYHVRMLDLLIYGTQPIADVINHPNLEVMQADFRQVDKVVEAVRNVDAIVHLGAIVGDPACALDEELTIEVNLMATRMIAEVGKGSNVSRFIFASTCSVYGANTEMLDEHSALNPISIYARSKIASERVLTSMAAPGFGPTSLRFGTIYGLSGRTRFDLVVNLLAAQAKVDHHITIFGGDQWRPFVHVNDAAEAVLMTLEAPLTLVGNQIFNVGSDEQNHTIQQVGEIITGLIPGVKLVSEEFDTDKRDYRVSFAKIVNTLGFKPQWTVEEGVKQVIEAMDTGRVKNYRDAQHSNVKFLGDEGASRLIRRQNGWAHELINESAQENEVAGARVPARDLRPLLAAKAE
ncbi:MAG TPA: NAD(P)-dependent oxidoreductase [Pyrinomonadaceae bacterium]|nr:NAD(P)-dependent oxidoreductase [Pyrinomonadaceae bacterium]